ncbi:MAG TPA: hypothetical protein VLI06_08650 [Solimonas sp.]|nr:hypothetical protein [Solimonas sp.]
MLTALLLSLSWIGLIAATVSKVFSTHSNFETELAGDCAVLTYHLFPRSERLVAATVYRPFYNPVVVWHNARTGAPLVTEHPNHPCVRYPSSLSREYRDNLIAPELRIHYPALINLIVAPLVVVWSIPALFLAGAGVRAALSGAHRRRYVLFLASYATYCLLALFWYHPAWLERRIASSLAPGAALEVVLQEFPDGAPQSVSNLDIHCGSLWSTGLLFGAERKGTFNKEDEVPGPDSGEFAGSGTVVSLWPGQVPIVPFVFGYYSNLDLCFNEAGRLAGYRSRRLLAPNALIRGALERSQSWQ